MTCNTSRYNIEPMLRFVAVPMMVLFSLFFAIRILQVVMALQSIRLGHFASPNSTPYSITSFSLFRMFNLIMSYSFAKNNFTLFALLIPFGCYFAFCSSTITKRSLEICHLAFFSFLIFPVMNFTASFTVALKTIFSCAVLVKFIQWFEILATRTLFCLNCLSHNRLLCRRLRLEPYTGTYLYSARLL